MEEYFQILSKIVSFHLFTSSTGRFNEFNAGNILFQRNNFGRKKLKEHARKLNDKIICALVLLD